MLVKPAALGLKGRPADSAVRALLKGPQLGQGQGLPLPLHHRRGIELLVLALEPVFLLHQIHDLRLHGAHADLQVGKQQLPKPLLQGGPEGGCQQGQIDFLADLLEGGADLVHIAVFPVVKCILRIYGVADIGQGAGGIDSFLQLLELQIGVYLLLGGGGGGNPLQQSVGGFLESLQVWPLIGHFCKLHAVSPC